MLFIALLFFLGIAQAADILTASGCVYGPGITSYDGLNVKAYTYPIGNSELYSDYSFLASLYTTMPYIGEGSGVTDPDFSTRCGEGVTYSSMYGLNIPVSNVIMSYTGYFKAPETGVYTFKLQDIDDAAMVWLGSGLSCCDTGALAGSADDAIVVATKAYHGALGEKSGYVYLEEGQFYPFRLTFINIITASELDFIIITPGGTSISNFGGYMFQIANPEDSCSTSTVSIPVATSTSAGSTATTKTDVLTTTNGGGVTYTQTQVVVVTTAPSSSSVLSSSSSSVLSSKSSSIVSSTSSSIVPRSLAL